MTLPPEVERSLADLVRSGRFPSAEVALAVAVSELADGASADLAWDETLDAEDLAAIAEADAVAERGDVVDLETFRAEVAKWFVEPR